ncbi:hypothetical protein YC2023_078730 [Brassica napus]
MRNERDSVEDKIHHLNWSLKFDDTNENDKQEMLSAFNDLEFHKVWGQLMKTGYQSSRFANEIQFGLDSFLLDFIGLSSVNISDVEISAYSSVDV